MSPAYTSQNLGQLLETNVCMGKWSIIELTACLVIDRKVSELYSKTIRNWLIVTEQKLHKIFASNASTN